MTNRETDTEESRGEMGIISKADRYALLKMLEEKPRAVIQSALRDAARRGLFTDKMLDAAPAPSGAGRVLKLTMLMALLLLAGALAYVGSREHITMYMTMFMVPKEQKSLMGITPDDMATAATKIGDEKYEIIYSRLSEPVRNVFKNHLPEPDIEARGNINCPPDTKQRDFTAKASQRNAEPANKWIERMTAINKAGKTNELQTELKKFRQAYPSIVLPPALQALVC
jgi:hypothetical protein